MRCKNNGTKIGLFLEKRNYFRVLKAPLPVPLTQKKEFPQPRTLYFQNLDDVEISRLAMEQKAEHTERM